MTVVCRFEEDKIEGQEEIVEEEKKEEDLKPDDMEFIGPGHDFEPVEIGREEKFPKQSTIILRSTTKGRHLKRVLKCLPVSRKKLENMKSVKMLNSFQK